MTEIDLEAGRVVEEKRRQQQEGTKTKRETPRRSVRDKVETEVESRLERIFGRIARVLKERGDDELGDAIGEEAKPMTSAFVSLTKNVPFLRSPFILVLSLVEVLLAFGRVGSILFSRYMQRRLRRQAEYEAAQAAAAEQPEEYQSPANAAFSASRIR